MTKLTTKYAEGMTKSCPHSYHPTPSFVREGYLSLNGEWSFSLTRDNVTVYDGKITVPFPPESELSGVCRAISEDETMHYRRRVTLPEDMKGGRVILHLGAVDQECEVTVSGVKVCEHRGGYLPFSVDLTEHIGDGDLTLEVIAKDPLSEKYPYGKQTKKRGGMWYTPVSGIWQSVWLEAVPKEGAIESLKITPTEDGVILKVVGGVDKKRVTLDDGTVIEFEGEECEIKPKELVKWTPETPELYYFTVESGIDRVKSYFAVRTIGTATADGKEYLTLNGERYIFNGLLDQGYYPDGLFMPATEEGYLDDIRLAKSLGFNMLRKHIKIEPEIFYYLCDREGVAVFQDMVNNGHYSFIRDTVLPTVGLQRMSDKHLHKDPESRRIFEETMIGTAELLYNHPSIVYYTVFNEGWGQFSADETYGKLKAVDNTRIVDSTSGWFRRSLSDVDSRHIYFRRLKVKHPSGKPLSISEFGGYSHRVEGHLFGDENYGYRLFAEREKFEEAFYDLYKNEVAPLVKDGASAFVYTQLSDVEDETNGLVTYDREVVKVDKDRCRRVMAEVFTK